MRKYFIAICFAIFCCTGYAQPTVAPVKLGYFVSTPPVIDGCEGDYTYDTTALIAKKYIFITNLQGLVDTGQREDDLLTSGKRIPAG